MENFYFQLWAPHNNSFLNDFKIKEIFLHLAKNTKNQIVKNEKNYLSIHENALNNFKVKIFNIT